MAAPTGVEPARIGRYSLHGEIASGGMATVYYGRDVLGSEDGATVAVKKPHPHIAKDPKFVAMFLDDVPARFRRGESSRDPGVMLCTD